MMEMIDFAQYPSNMRVYGGAAGRKLGINMEGENYIIKFPGNLKEKNFKTVRLSYSNSPVCEYIGSHIYESLGIPVHETKLGYFQDKIVVGCKDFLEDSEQLIEFEKMKVTFLPRFTDSNGEETNGNGTDLKEIILTIKEHPLLKIEGVEDRFWDMFIGDALIGNPDRNNGNWGIIKDNKNEVRLAPVYDNGNCLNNKWDEERMQEALSDPVKLRNEAYARKVCIFELNNHHVKPYEFIASKKNAECNKALGRVVPKINMKKIKHIIDEIPFLSDVQKNFYQSVIRERYEKVLYPTLKELENVKFLLPER